MKKRNIALAIVFTIITFGIYGIYWFVCLTNDSNRMNSAEATASGGMAVLFTIITFGIYSFYWAYKLGKKGEIRGVIPGSQPVRTRDRKLCFSAIEN
ncbi:MAG: DUF4234 domain-containing protein [Christensenellaceae bacterium]